jgi:NAD(P)H-nitrite reductase large subunit
MNEDMIVCRCEEVTSGEIRKAIREGAHDIDTVKRMTRAGMGLCQNKACFNIIAKLISEEAHIELSQLKPSTSRPPVRPLKMSLLKDLE